MGLFNAILGNASEVTIESASKEFEPILIEGEEIEKLFDFDESSMWHTDWSNKNAVPFDIILDLKILSYNEIHPQ